MNKRIILIFLFIIGILLIIAVSLGKRNKALKEEVSVLESNQKAFVAENSSLRENTRVFKFTIDQLEYYNDSIIDKLNKVKDELNIKNKNLQQMQYLLSEAQRTDTIIFKDTLFKDPYLNIDTLIQDNWYKLKLNLKYPNTIISSPSFISEKYIITSYKKETIKPPKKCWLLRIFQRKHKVVEVDIVEKNPYIENKQQKFIEILK